VDWGDGTPEQTYVQVGATGVTINHLYPNTSIACGYDVVIDAENACNPRGSVVPISTQVVCGQMTYRHKPAVYRVCQGYAATVASRTIVIELLSTSHARKQRARWIQWLYGTGSAATRIPGMQVNAISPGSYPTSIRHL